MISSRFAPAVCVLGALALVPTAIHSYAKVTTVDGRQTSAIPSGLIGYSSAPTDRNATWGQRRFDSFDWLERSYTKGDDKVRLTVVRSYDPKSLYHHPELAVAYGTGFVRSTVVTLPEASGVPLHVLHSDRDGGPLAVYALHYNDRFVADPIRFQLQTALELLFSGRKAMTLFFVTDQNAESADVSTLPATRLLLAAVDEFMAATPQR